MKTFQYLTMCIAALSGFTASAATNSSMEEVSGKPAMTVGIQGGLSFANASTPSEISSSTRTGFLGGINLQFKLSSLLAIQPELMYVQRGASLISSGGIKLSAETDSVEVPVLVRVSFGERFRPYVFAGPVAVFNLSNRLVAGTGSSTGGVSYNPRAFDLAADIGAGVELESFFLNLRYSAGLLQNDLAAGNWQSRGFQLLLGVNLGV